MAAIEEPDPAHEQPNRATLALVHAELRGLRDLAQANFGNLQAQLEKLDGLPVEVATLKAQNANQEGRIHDLEQGNVRAAGWRWSLIAAGVAATPGVLALLLHVG